MAAQIREAEGKRRMALGENTSLDGKARQAGRNRIQIFRRPFADRADLAPDALYERLRVETVPQRS